MKKHAPAALRNREPIAEVLADELPASGRVLEIASGSGEHAVHFAARFPALEWLPSDREEEALASIAAWRAQAGLANLHEPVLLDAAAGQWPVGHADAIVCINMVHISPWEASEGLFAGAGRLLGQGAPLVLYGPFFEREVETAPSNLAFDESLRARDSRWGLRQREAVDRLAARHGFSLATRREMPANNLTLVYRRD